MFPQRNRYLSVLANEFINYFLRHLKNPDMFFDKGGANFGQVFWGVFPQRNRHFILKNQSEKNVFIKAFFEYFTFIKEISSLSKFSVMWILRRKYVCQKIESIHENFDFPFLGYVSISSPTIHNWWVNVHDIDTFLT